MIKTYAYQETGSLKDRVHHSLMYGGLHHFFMGVILLYAAFLSLTGTPLQNETYDWMQEHVHVIFWGLFVFEILLKLFVARWKFFENAWNVIDGSLLLITLLIPQIKVLRILRLFVYVNTFLNHKIIDRVFKTLVQSLPSLMTSGGLLLSLMFGYGLLATVLFGEKFPEYFGNVGISLYTLFQIMTLESWSAGVVRPIMDIYPWAWVMFVSYILLSTYGITNIFVGVIVNAMSAVDSTAEKEVSMNDLQRELKEIKKLLNKSK